MTVSSQGDGFILMDTKFFKHVTLVAFDPGTGEIRWSPEKISIGESPKHGIALNIDREGNPVVLANGNNYEGTTLSHLAKLSRTDGYPLWEAVYHGANRQSFYPLALASDSEGNVAVFGNEYSGGVRHPTLIKYRGTDGGAIWGAR